MIYIIIELDVSGIKFDYVDFTEAYLFLDKIPEANQKFSIRSWGVTLLPDLKIYFGDDYSDDMYIAGFCEIIFEEIISAKIEMGLYQEKQIETPYCNYTKIVNKLSINKCWGVMKAYEDETMYYNDDNIYILGGILEFPEGYCQLDVYSKYKVILRYNKEDVISAEEYCNNTNKYSYKKQLTN